MLAFLIDKERLYLEKKQEINRNGITTTSNNKFPLEKKSKLALYF